MRIAARKKTRQEKGTSAPFVRIRVEWLWHRGSKFNDTLCSQAVSFDRTETTWIEVLGKILTAYGQEITPEMWEKYNDACERMKEIDRPVWDQFCLDFAPAGKTGGAA